MGNQISSPVRKAAASSENHPQGIQRDSNSPQQELRDSSTRTSEASTRTTSQDLAPRRDVALPSSVSATTTKSAMSIPAKIAGCLKPDFMVGAPPVAHASLEFTKAHSGHHSDVDEDDDDSEDTGSSDDDGQSENDMPKSAHGARPLPSSSPIPHVAPRAEARENATPAGILTKRSETTGSLVVNGPLVQRGQCRIQMSHPVRRHVTFQDAPSPRGSDSHHAAQDSGASEATPASTAQPSPARPHTAPAAMEQASRAPPIAVTPSVDLNGIPHALGGLVEEAVGCRGSLFAKEVKSGRGVLYDTQVDRHPFWAYPPPDISESNRELDRELEESAPIIDGFDDDFMDAYCNLYAQRTDVIEQGMEMHRAEFEHLYERYLFLKLKLKHLNDERESVLTDESTDESWLAPKLRKQLLIKIAHDEKPLKEEFPHAEQELEECLMRGRTKLAGVLRPDFALPNAIEGWRTRAKRRKAAEEESEELGIAAAMIGLRGRLKDQSFSDSQIIQRNAQLVVDDKMKEFGHVPRGAKGPFLSLEDNFHNLVSAVPAWFTVLEAKGIIKFEGPTPLDRFKVLLRVLANSAVSTQPVQEEAAESAEAKLTKQFHEPNPGWRTEKQRQCGGWFTCRSGPDATVAEVICRLCHPEGAATGGDQASAGDGPAPRADQMNLLELVEQAMAEANERDRLMLKYQQQQEQADFEQYWKQRERSRDSGREGDYLQPLSVSGDHETNSRLCAESFLPWQHQSSMLNTHESLAEHPEDNCVLPDFTGPTGPTGPSSAPPRPTLDRMPRFVRMPSSAPVGRQADTAARPPHQVPQPPLQSLAQQGGQSPSTGLSIDQRIDLDVYERVQRRMRLLRMSRAEREEVRRQGPEPVGPSWRDAFRYRPGEPPGRQLRKKWGKQVDLAQIHKQWGITATQIAPGAPALQVTRYSHNGLLAFNGAAPVTHAEPGLFPSHSQTSSQGTLAPSEAASGARAEAEAEAGPSSRSAQICSNTGTCTLTGAGSNLEIPVTGPSSSSRQSLRHGRSHNDDGRSHEVDVLSRTPRGRTHERRAAGTGIGNGNAARRAGGARSTSAMAVLARESAQGGRGARSQRGLAPPVLMRPSALRRAGSSSVRVVGRGKEKGKGKGKVVAFKE